MRADLIAELRTTHALQLPERKEIKRQEEEILGEQRAREKQQHFVSLFTTLRRNHCVLSS